MGSFLEQMMKISLTAVVSGMETIAETMHEVQQKAEAPDEDENTDDPYTSAYNSVSRLAIVPLIEIAKLPITVIMKTISEATQGIQEHGEEGNEVHSGQEEEAVDQGREVVPLNAQEAALETETTLSEEAEEMYQNTIWQIGRSGRNDFQGKWAATFDYQVGTDLDEVNSPGIPHLITVQDGPKSKGAAEKLNVHFALDRDYADGELAFIYDRWGAEKDQVFVDGELLAPVGGVGKGMFKHVALSLKDVSDGDHVITITTSGETEAGGHRIDYLKLSEIEKSAEQG
ncbi:MAG: hypothetical protein HOH43_20465 [Candidatus Latescibacteria bacterium]|nr:hypothetical protein [Candidatus Latescibacterota bacterium]